MPISLLALPLDVWTYAVKIMGLVGCAMLLACVYVHFTRTPRFLKRRATVADAAVMGPKTCL